MSFLRKFRKRILGLNHVVFCNPDFALVRNANKMVQMAKTWFSVSPRTTWFKKTRWVGTLGRFANLTRWPEPRALVEKNGASPLPYDFCRYAVDSVVKIVISKL